MARKMPIKPPRELSDFVTEKSVWMTDPDIGRICEMYRNGMVSMKVTSPTQATVVLTDRGRARVRAIARGKG